MGAITLHVNGVKHTLELNPAIPLPYVLSDDLELRGPKFGCGLGQCGACTVIVKGQAIRSCITPVKSVEGFEIRDEQKITSVDWRTFNTLPLGFDIPNVETTLINWLDQDATGAGELSITIAAAAVGNAIFGATGIRLRELPFTPERVKAALSQT